MAGFSAQTRVTPGVRPAAKPTYSYSGGQASSTPVQPAAASITPSYASEEPVPGLKTPGEITSSKVEKGINIPTFLQKNRR